MQLLATMYIIKHQSGMSRFTVDMNNSITNCSRSPPESWGTGSWPRPRRRRWRRPWRRRRPPWRRSWTSWRGAAGRHPSPRMGGTAAVATRRRHQDPPPPPPSSQVRKVPLAAASAVHPTGLLSLQARQIHEKKKLWHLRGVLMTCSVTCLKLNLLRSEA